MDAQREGMLVPCSGSEGKKTPLEAAGAMLSLVRRWEMGDVATPSLTPKLCFAATAAL